MKWRDDVPLSEADYAAIRAKVMREVSVRRSPFAVRRIGFAFAALAAVLAVVVLRPVEDSRPRLSFRPPGQSRVAVLHGTTPPPQTANGDRQTANVAPATVVAHKHHRPRKHTPAAVLIATRIDIQTADPDVRIIWFAR